MTVSRAGMVITRDGHRGLRLEQTPEEKVLHEDMSNDGSQAMLLLQR